MELFLACQAARLLLKLPAGEHKVIVERAGYQRFEQKVKIDDTRVGVECLRFLDVAGDEPRHSHGRWQHGVELL